MIADQTYTIIGQESKQHMDMVTKLINEQLAELKELSPQLDNEQAAILLAVNAFSDQLKRQGKKFEFNKRSHRTKTKNGEIHRKEWKIGSNESKPLKMKHEAVLKEKWK